MRINEVTQEVELLKAINDTAPTNKIAIDSYPDDDDDFVSFHSHLNSSLISNVYSIGIATYCKLHIFEYVIGSS